MIACTQQRQGGFGVHVSGQSGAEGAGRNSGLRLLEGSCDMQLAVAKVAHTVACRCHQTAALGWVLVAPRAFGPWTEICRDPSWSSRTGSGVSDLLLLSMLHGHGIGTQCPSRFFLLWHRGNQARHRGSSNHPMSQRRKYVSNRSIHVPASCETTRWRRHLHDSSHVCLAWKQR